MVNDKQFFDNIFDNKLNPEEVKNFLIQLYQEQETAEQIAAAALSMREHLIPLPIYETLQTQLIDNCGTGGDKSNSFNISTTVSLLLSSCGLKVAKHGNVSITSKSGSADMLRELGLNLDLSIENQVKMLQETGFAFMFAKNHHPAMKYVMPIRKSIPHRTIFNILGPLSNPAGVTKQLIGVFDKDFIPKIAKALTILGVKRAIVVSSNDNMDEISISDINYGQTIFDNQIADIIIDPRDYGFKLYDKSEIVGADAQENAKITKDILSGALSGAKLDIVLLNAGFALFADGIVNNPKDGIELARDAINSGKAKEKLEQIIHFSSKFDK